LQTLEAVEKGANRWHSAALMGTYVNRQLAVVQAARRLWLLVSGGCLLASTYVGCSRPWTLPSGACKKKKEAIKPPFHELRCIQRQEHVAEAPKEWG
jgi:hypothetical protein